MRLIVTRPAAQAAAWVDGLRALGLDALALPLIEIGPPADAAPVRAAWQRLAGFSLVMFVSANAVQHFFAHAGGAWPAGVRAASTGPGTSAALSEAGVAAHAIVEPPADAGRFDSEALWAQLSDEDWAGRRALIVRGEDGRDWLAETLKSRGAAIEFVAAYRRLPPQLDAAQHALLQAAQREPAAHLWLFSSSEAVRHLRALAPAASWSASRALASHPRIAQAAREAGFGTVRERVLPDPAALAAWLAQQGPSIQSGAS